MIDVCRRQNSGTPPIYGTGSNETFFVRVNILIHLIDFLFLFRQSPVQFCNSV